MSVETEIVRAVVQLGHALGKRVIAEGIETEDQLARLRALGCGFAQGFLLGRPLGSEQAAALLCAAGGRAEPGSARGMAPAIQDLRVAPREPSPLPSPPFRAAHATPSGRPRRPSAPA
jgi:predicted signal transduction protein with EAL and GGDEF domain